MSYHFGRDPYDDPSAIERRMEELRCELLQRERSLIQSAHKLTYWTRQIRKHSWVVVGIGAAAGFLMLRRSTPQVNLPAAEAQATQSRARSARSSVSGVITKTLVGVLVRFAGMLAMRELQRLTDDSRRRREQASEPNSPHAANGAPPRHANNSNQGATANPVHSSSLAEQSRDKAH